MMLSMAKPRRAVVHCLLANSLIVLPDIIHYFFANLAYLFDIAKFFAKYHGKMLDGHNNAGQKKCFDDNDNEDAFIPVVRNIGNVECLFYSIVDKSDDDPMCAEDKHCADGEEGDKAKMFVVEAAAKVNDAVDREKVDDIIKDNVKNETVFVNMPVE